MGAVLGCDAVDPGPLLRVLLLYCDSRCELSAGIYLRIPAVYSSSNPLLVMAERSAAAAASNGLARAAGLRYTGGRRQGVGRGQRTAQVKNRYGSLL